MNDGTDYRAILLAGTPIIDVRAPVEFLQGAMPGAINLPLMNDDERAAVGTCYKRQGPEAALTLGHQLVRGETRQQRMKAWLDACRQNPAGYLCCARGGQRSHIVRQWLHESGIDYPLIHGGYKALRQAAIQLTEELVQKPIVLIGGCTGNGKTQLVQQQPNGVDLEGLAHHRGSSFGRTVEPQLSQASFENLLAVEMLRTDSRQDLRLWVLEDEGRMIGANHLPECLRERMTQASIAVVDDPFERRLERLREEYFVRMHHDFTHAYGESQGWQEYSEYLHHRPWISVCYSPPSGFTTFCRADRPARRGSARTASDGQYRRPYGLAGTVAQRVLRPDVSLSTGKESRESRLSRHMAGRCRLA